MMRMPRRLCGDDQKRKAAQQLRAAGEACHMLNLQVAWLAALLNRTARITRNSCRQAFIAWPFEKTGRLAVQAEAGDSTAVWHLARMLRVTSRRPRTATAPVRDEQGRTVTHEDELSALWVRQFSEIFSGHVTRVPQEGLERLLIERKAQSQSYDTVNPSGCPDLAFPTVVGQWFDFLQARVQKYKRGKQVGADKTPNELYAAAGEAGILQLAFLLQKVKAQGPPQS